MNVDVSLESLVGEHYLDAVDVGHERLKLHEYREFENSEYIRFRLDGKVYMAIEDPSDGYRSSMDGLYVVDVDMTNTFPSQKVIGRHRTKRTTDYGWEYTDDVLELIDAVTGKIVLEVGTDNTDDYYPSFVAHFDPTAMAINAA